MCHTALTLGCSRSVKTAMNLYGHWLLPRLIDLAMRNPQATRQREAMAAAARSFAREWSTAACARRLADVYRATQERARAARIPNVMVAS